tara:strand:+ start:1841 stop:2146 length:306 start_codon:yes stop_codon:yes gene_type:complete
MLIYENFINNDKEVHGVAVVFKDYDNQLHYHPVDEEYNILYGTGVLHLNNKVYEIKAGDNILIPKNSIHSMKPTSRYVILRYYFPEGPFEKIPYTWLSSRL